VKLHELTRDDKELVEKAKTLLRKRRSEISGVSAGLRTSRGTEFYGLCVDAKTATVGICAEYAAIGTMVTSGEKRISTMVAVAYKGKGRYVILPPCGKCRDFAREFGNPYVILQIGRGPRDAKKVRVSDLVPFPWNRNPEAQGQ
jgi:cytidine deaminase